MTKLTAKKIRDLYTDIENCKYAFSGLRKFQIYLKSSHQYEISIKALKEILNQIDTYARFSTKKQQPKYRDSFIATKNISLSIIFHNLHFFYECISNPK